MRPADRCVITSAEPSLQRDRFAQAVHEIAQMAIRWRQGWYLNSSTGPPVPPSSPNPGRRLPKRQALKRARLYVLRRCADDVHAVNSWRSRRTKVAKS